MTEMIIEYLTRNVVIVPILLFLLGMLAGVTLTWRFGSAVGRRSLATVAAATRHAAGR